MFDVINLKLLNETALITGSTSGIGKKIAEILLKEGCKVAICSSNKDNVEKTLSEFKEQFGDSVIGFTCDVNNIGDLKNITEKIISSFGSIRILIANAGVNTVYGPFDCLTPEMVESNAKIIFGVNLAGAINTISSVLPYMINQKYGRIITLSGGGADRPIDNMTLYSASKGGIVTFSKCLAYELAQREEDIKINIFQPGMLKTNLTTDFTCVPNWKTEEEIRKDLDFVLEHLGGDIEKRTAKVIPYVIPKCKKNGKVFRGFKLFKLIIQAIKMQRNMKKRKK
ncbi:MAG: SDR family oxidoreductase [Asgard group archaeon]|nr:SDR family oxidoreductase [Asgard group archaeon]